MSKSDDNKNSTSNGCISRPTNSSEQKNILISSNKPPRDLDPATLRVVTESYDPALDRKMYKRDKNS